MHSDSVPSRDARRGQYTATVLVEGAAYVVETKTSRVLRLEGEAARTWAALDGHGDGPADPAIVAAVVAAGLAEYVDP